MYLHIAKCIQMYQNSARHIQIFLTVSKRMIVSGLWLIFQKDGFELKLRKTVKIEVYVLVTVVI